MHMRSSYLFSVVICCFRVRCQLNLQSHQNTRKWPIQSCRLSTHIFVPNFLQGVGAYHLFSTLWAPLMDTIPSWILYGWQHIIRGIFNHMIVDENYWRFHEINKIYLIIAYLLWKFGYKRRLAKFLSKSRINPTAHVFIYDIRTKFKISKLHIKTHIFLWDVVSLLCALALVVWRHHSFKPYI